MRQISLVFAILLFAQIAGAQEGTPLYIPKEIKNAIKKGTRTSFGMTGPEYFQNRSDYKIVAEFNPKTGVLKGKEKISYTNNSPDTLKSIHFHLFQDIFKKGNRRDFDLGERDVNSGVTIHSLSINGMQFDMSGISISRSNSLLNIALGDKMEPKSKIEIEIEWEFTVAEFTPVRMGKYGEDNFMMAYWYPKIVVYDDIFGWNTTGYSGAAEFYHDFGNYDVELTVPNDYQIWATATLTNPNEVYTDEILEKIEFAKKSTVVSHIITSEDRKNFSITKNNNTTNVWKFKSEHMPDFAFAVSKSYLWDGVRAENGTSEGVFVSAVYKESSHDFHEVCEISKNAVEFFSEISPKISYPYSQLTAFNGDGGMEFPGMINDGDMPNHNSTLYVTAHEIGHSYFPFALGLNEQKYAWMDEGLISFLPRLFENKYTKTSDYNAFTSLIEAYNNTAGSFYDVPPVMLSEVVTGQYPAYRFHAYTRSGTAFYLLSNEIGTAKFNAGLKLFAERWSGKHPTPYDLLACFEDAAGENLNWFWQPWMNEIGYADLALNVDKEKFAKQGKVIVKKIGRLPAPISLKISYNDGSSENILQKASIWATKNEVTIKVNNPKNVKSLILDYTLTPDAFPENNTIQF